MYKCMHAQLTKSEQKSGQQVGEMANLKSYSHCIGVFLSLAASQVDKVEVRIADIL